MHTQQRPAIQTMANLEAAGRPEDNIAAGTRWADVPADWACPDCGVAKAKLPSNWSMAKPLTWPRVGLCHAMRTHAHTC